MKKRILSFCFMVMIIIVGLIIFTKKTSAPAHKTDDIKLKNPVSAPSFDKKKYSTTSPNSIWVVVNKPRPLNPLTYTPSSLVSVGGKQTMQKEAASALSNLFSGAKSQGMTLSAISAYRSYETQVSVYNREVASVGQVIADTESAKPGHSEHQTGLAVDIGGGGCGIEDCFGNTKEGQWVATHGYEYGFIVRYTKGKESVTGYRAEPWHIRYVGVELSTEMHKQNITTLEEFFNL